MKNTGHNITLPLPPVRYRYAYWSHRDRNLSIIGVNCSSDPVFEVSADLHTAAQRIRELVEIEIVTHGLLLDAAGQYWSEKLERVEVELP